MSNILKNAEASEQALLELIAEGKRISQHAVEKRAGLANGALNYKHPRYQKVKEKINTVKLVSESKQRSAEQEFKALLVKEQALKDKYRNQRNALKQKLRELEGERLELQYQLYHLQKYLAKLEENGIASSNVLKSPPPNRGHTR